MCKECGGKGICIHAVRRSECCHCLTKDQQIKSGRFCCVCEHILTNKRQRDAKAGGFKGEQVCGTCDPDTPVRTELVVRPKLLALVDHPPESADNTLFGTDCNVDRQRRPDLLWCVRHEVDGRILGFVKFGCDEDSHNLMQAGKTRKEHIQCELGKVGNQFESLAMLVWREDVLRAEGSKEKLSLRMLSAKALEARSELAESVPMRGVPMFFIKWNPDGCDKGRSSLYEERVPAIAKYINDLLRRIQERDLPTDFDVGRPHVSFHYFHSKCDDIVRAFDANPIVLLDVVV